jgi:hypothetical protein
MASFLGGLFIGIIIGMLIGLLFSRNKWIEVKPIDDEKTRELMKLLDLAEDD